MNFDLKVNKNNVTPHYLLKVPYNVKGDIVVKLQEVDLKHKDFIIEFLLIIDKLSNSNYYNYKDVILDDYETIFFDEDPLNVLSLEHDGYYMKLNEVAVCYVDENNTHHPIDLIDKQKIRKDKIDDLFKS